MKVPSLIFLHFLFITSFLITACGSDSAITPTIGTSQPTALPSATATQQAETMSATATIIPPTRTPAPTLAFSGEPSIGSIITGADGATLLFVPQGDFIMGADADDLLAACQDLRSDCRREWFENVEPARTVTLNAFWIDQTEVTNKMYKTCVDADICKPPFQSDSYKRDHYFGNPRYDEYPVIYIAWEQAETYCTWAGRRLPSEAEWEKAARGTDGRLYPWGNNKPTSTLSNYSLYEGDTTPVKKYPNGTSPYGAYDMTGNVWEWTADWYDGNYYKAAPSSNPTGPYFGIDKVSRGSAWIYYDFDTFVTDRYGNAPKTTNNIIGFRCARDR